MTTTKQQSCLKGHRARWFFALVSLFASVLPLAPGNAVVEEKALRLAVYIPQEGTNHVYQPLADYLGEKVGRPVKLITTINFLTHWQLFKRENYELVLDGPHFTDYRVQKMGYRPVAKFPSVVSYSLVTSEDLLILEAKELIARKIATPPSPGLGALWLNDLYPNPLRQPKIVEADNSTAAVEKVLSGEAVAAMIPTPFVQRYRSVIPVQTTEQVPAPALSVSGQVDDALAERIRQALLSASDTRQGRAMLEAIKVPRFEPASQQTYEGMADALKGVWGY